MSDAPFRVALTFDMEAADRPTTPGTSAAILDALAADGVRATAFIQGRWAEAEPALVARIAADGHLVANHSHHHAKLTLLTGAGIERDCAAAERAIERAAGVSPRPWYRCPFGIGARSPRVIERLARRGYVDVSWHVDTRDWSGVTSRTIRRRAVDGAVAYGDGAVVLMHGWPPGTPGAIPGIVADLRARGATFVGVDELDDVPGLRP